MISNNDILRRIRYTFEFKDSKMIEIFALSDYHTDRTQVSDWLKKPGDPAFKEMIDSQLASFLNGFIILKRGSKDGPPPEAENRLNNNIIFRKLKIALNLKDVDILEILTLVNVSISKHELSAFFRNPKHQHFRSCMDQMLRNFLHGMQIKYRGNKVMPS